MNGKSIGVRSVRFQLAVGLLLSAALPLLAEPRSPQPPWPEANPLSQMTWNAVLTPMRDDSSQAVGQESATLVESWSGYALQREGVMVAPVVLPGLNAKAKANLGHGQGCVRFWFAPNWESGKGPGQVSRMAEWIVTDGQQVGTLWALSVNEDGSVISLGSEGGGVLQAAINWGAGSWHLVALNYSETGTELYVDGAWVAAGAGLLAVEPKISGLVVGSDWQGLLVAGGVFDDWMCYAEPMSGEDLAFYYRGMAKVAALGPLSEAESAVLNAPRLAGMEDGGSFARMMFDESNPCPTNGLVFMTNLWCELDTNSGWTMTFDVADGTNGILYDVFSSSNLAGATEMHGAWYWVTNTCNCTTVVLTNQPEFYLLYILGTPQDSDADGLTDAYENLVTKTDPNNADTDGDGVDDYLEVLQGRNPNAAGAVPDTSGVVRLATFTPLR